MFLFEKHLGPAEPTEPTEPTEQAEPPEPAELGVLPFVVLFQLSLTFEKKKKHDLTYRVFFFFFVKSCCDDD